MQKAFDQFNENISYVKELKGLHDHLINVLHLPNDFSILLRTQWMYAVSALDKLIHETIRLGMIEAFKGTRTKTAKFTDFPIPYSTYQNIIQATIPPPEFYFEQEIIQKHKILSFQDPDKINEALSLVWDEKHKWFKIAVVLAMDEKDVKTTLRTIIQRRNQIVHEADIDLQTGTRLNIEVIDTDLAVTFIENLGVAIFNLVR